jgi:murein DD-endopeptidase MepM/ murein hydrolase activator NlpD
MTETERREQVRQLSKQRPRPASAAATTMFVLSTFFFLLSPSASADVLDDLRQRLLERRQAVQNIEERIQKHREDVSRKKQEALTLQSQIKIIDDGVGVLTLEIEKTEAEVNAVKAEITAIQEDIRIVEQDIERRKELLKEYLRELQVLDSDSVIEALLKYATLSAGLTEVQAIYRVEKDSQETIDRIQELRTSLKGRAEAFTDLQRELDVLLTRQTSQKQTLEDQRVAKNRLLEITKEQEEEFKKFLSTTVEEQKRANAEITRIDAQIRAELERQGIKRLGGVGIFDWPVDPIFGVSCGFHCPDYPYQSLIGPHSGIDLPTHMGTEIRAAADAYVARNSIASGAGYSYILLIHGDNLSTVYGHISGATVAEGSFITRGQRIGYTGGAPGTRGSGLSTGPHLHFEVRKNGIPVNPTGYLP